MLINLMQPIQTIDLLLYNKLIDLVDEHATERNADIAQIVMQAYEITITDHTRQKNARFAQQLEKLHSIANASDDESLNADQILT